MSGRKTASEKGNGAGGVKPADKKQENLERQERISRKKSDMTVIIIQHNQAINKMIRQMSEALAECERSIAAFNGQRMLFAKVKMQERVLNSALRMMEQNKMQFWMIDDAALESEEENAGGAGR